MSTRAIAGRSLYSERVDLQLQRHTETGLYVGALSWRHVAEGAEAGSTVALDPAAAQELMDSLWQCGLRPTDGSGSAGALAATQEHLADMRSIDFRLLDRGEQPRS